MNNEVKKKNYKINKITPCTGSIYNNNNKEQYNIRLHYKFDITNIINNMVTVYEKEDEESTVYYGYVDKCDASMEYYYEKEVPEKSIELHCTINKDNKKFIDNIKYKYDNNYVDYLDNFFIDNYIKYLDNIDAKLLYRKNNIFVIVPNIYYMIVTNEYVDKLKSYIKNRNTDDLYEYLQLFSFQLLIRDNKIKNILDINLKCAEYIQNEIHNFIDKIVDHTFDYTMLTYNVFQAYNNLVYIEFHINDIRDVKYNDYYYTDSVSIRLDELIYRLKNNNPISYKKKIRITSQYYNEGHMYNNIKNICENDQLYAAIDEIRLDNNQLYDNLYKPIITTENKYFDNIRLNHYLIVGKNSDEIYSESSIYLKITKDIGKKINYKFIKNKVNVKYKNLIVVSYYAKNNISNKKCFHKFIMKNNGNEYYEITIHNITYHALNQIEIVRNKYIDIIEKCKESEYNMFYISPNRKYYINKFPGIFGLKFKKIDNKNIIPLYCVTETAEKYYENILKKIKLEILDRVHILMTILLNKSKNNIKSLQYYERMPIDEEIKKKFENNILFSKLFDGCFMMSECGNFYISSKVYFNDSYILWYFPEFNCENEYMDIIIKKILDIENNIFNSKLSKSENKLYIFLQDMIKNKSKKNQLLDKMIEYLQDINQNEDIKKNIVENSNYTRIFKSDEYKHNIRHITDNDCNEIDKLLYTFIKYKYKEKLVSGKFDKYKLIQQIYKVYHNYPQTGPNNTFHLQILSPYEYIFADPVEGLRSINNTNIINSRTLYWDKIKYSNNKERNIRLCTEKTEHNMNGENGYFKKFLRDSLLGK